MPSTAIATNQTVQSSALFSEPELGTESLDAFPLFAASDVRWESVGDKVSQTQDDPQLDFCVDELESQEFVSGRLSCPWCQSSDLHDLPSSVWCKCCEREAWIDDGEGLVRADIAENLVVGCGVSELV